MLLEKALTVAAAKAKIAGLVVAAAAVGGTAATTGVFTPTAGEEPVPTDVVATASPSTEASPVATASPSTEASPVATASPAPTPTPCPSDLANHGEYVSSVARDKSLKGREHGKAVSEAAHSDCGKESDDATDAAESEDADEVETPDVEDDADDDADEAAEPSAAPSPEAAKDKHGKGHGRG